MRGYISFLPSLTSRECIAAVQTKPWQSLFFPPLLFFVRLGVFETEPRGCVRVHIYSHVLFFLGCMPTMAQSEWAAWQTGCLHAAGDVPSRIIEAFFSFDRDRNYVFMPKEWSSYVRIYIRGGAGILREGWALVIVEFLYQVPFSEAKQGCFSVGWFHADIFAQIWFVIKTQLEFAWIQLERPRVNDARRRRPPRKYISSRI